MDLFSIVKGNRAFFAVVCGAMLAILLVGEGAYWRSVHSLDELNVIVESRASLRSVVLGLMEAQASQRGYLLTRKPEYLASYRGSLKRVDEAMLNVKRLLGGKNWSALDVARLETLVQGKRTQLDLLVHLLNEGRLDSTTEIAVDAADDAGMGAVRSLTEDMQGQEQLRFQHRADAIYQTLIATRIGLLAVCIATLLGLCLYLRNSMQHERHREDLNLALQNERNRLETEVDKRTHELTDLTRYLFLAREDERNRLARNLHDDLGALLTSAKLDAARIKSRVAKTAPEALELLAHLVETLNSSVALGRGIIENLRPSSLANLGLTTSLEILTREFGQSSGVEVHCDLQNVRLSPDAELTVFRLVQEALTNVARYAQAGQVWVRMVSLGQLAQISVRDNGVGFDTFTKAGGAYGLVGMRFRVESLGGELNLTSEPGLGTQIQATLAQLPAVDRQLLPTAADPLN